MPVTTSAWSSGIEQAVSRLKSYLLRANNMHLSMLSLFDQGIVSVTNFLTGVIVARSCSKEELGIYMLGYSLVLFVTDMQTALIAVPYMVYAPRLTPATRARYTGSTLIHQLVLSFATMLALACGAIAITFKNGQNDLANVVWALAAVAGLIMMREFVRRVCFAKLELEVALYLDIFTGAGQIGGLLVLAHFHRLSAIRTYWVAGAVCGLAVLCWFWFDREACQPRIEQSVADFKTNWTFGKWVFASGAVWTVSTNLYPWLLATFYGTGSAGVWAACVGVVSLGNPLLLGIQNLAGPKISHVYAARGYEGLQRLIWRMSGLMALPLSLLCLALSVFGGHLLSSLYGKQYAGNGSTVTVLALNLVVSAVVFSFSRALFAAERANSDFVANCAGLGVMAFLGIWLVFAFGPVGAAIGLLSANFVAFAVRAVFFLKHSHFPIQQQEVA
jgi:O-antigen/teichoic acid export membrane protein